MAGINAPWSSGGVVRIALVVGLTSTAACIETELLPPCDHEESVVDDPADEPETNEAPDAMTSAATESDTGSETGSSTGPGEICPEGMPTSPCTICLAQICCDALIECREDAACGEFIDCIEVDGVATCIERFPSLDASATVITNLATCGDTCYDLCFS